MFFNQKILSKNIIYIQHNKNKLLQKKKKKDLKHIENTFFSQA
jgi:hypothetical protein